MRIKRLPIILVFIFLLFNSCGRNTPTGDSPTVTTTPTATPTPTTIITATPTPPPVNNEIRGLDGAFIQIDSSTAQYSADRWLRELTYMQNLNMTKVIIAASVIDNAAYYPTGLSGRSEVGNQPIEKILNAADSLGMDVYVGLYLSDSWWQGTSTSYLDTLTLSSEAIVTELHALYSSHPSLKGFYIPQEIDNMTWVNETLRKRLVDHFLKPVSDHVKIFNSSYKVCEAPFYNNAYQQPAEYKTWWTNTLSETPNLDIVIPQDGIGAEHATYAEVVDYYTALASACATNGRSLWADLEIYNTVSDPVPADLGRIIRQISTEADLVDKITCWEWGYYLSPAHSIKSLELYNNYFRYLLGEGQISNVSSGESYTFSASPHASYPDSGGELTNGKARLNWSDQVGWLNQNYVTIEVDLGGIVSEIYNFQAYFMKSSSSAVNLPQKVDILVSENGADYYSVTSLEAIIEDDESINPYQLLLSSPVSARYVKFSIKPGVTWLMLSEVGVYTKQ